MNRGQSWDIELECLLIDLGLELYHALVSKKFKTICRDMTKWQHIEMQARAKEKSATHPNNRQDNVNDLRSLSMHNLGSHPKEWTGQQGLFGSLDNETIHCDLKYYSLDPVPTVKAMAVLIMAHHYLHHTITCGAPAALYRKLNFWPNQCISGSDSAIYHDSLIDAIHPSDTLLVDISTRQEACCWMDTNDININIDKHLNDIIPWIGFVILMIMEQGLDIYDIENVSAVGVVTLLQLRFSKLFFYVPLIDACLQLFRTCDLPRSFSFTSNC